MHEYKLLVPKRLWALIKVAVKESDRHRTIIAWIEDSFREKLEREKQE